MDYNQIALTRARVSRTAIEKLYVEMRHLVNRGVYKPWESSGKVIRDALLSLSPEIYGSMGDAEKVELNGLVYVIERLPKGIEACRYIRLISEEGFEDAGFEVIIPSARRRNCYRIDEERMYIEVTRGRSEIYDILTHLTFLFIEADKIRQHALDENGNPIQEWKKLRKIALGKTKLTEENQKVAYAYLSVILGRTAAETQHACERLVKTDGTNSGLFSVVYWLGKRAIEEASDHYDREISFSPKLAERIGHHLYGERWANGIKEHLLTQQLAHRPIHIISANMHSVMTSLYAYPALKLNFNKENPLEEVARELSRPSNEKLRDQVKSFAMANGMALLEEHYGTHIQVQIFDSLALLGLGEDFHIPIDRKRIEQEKPLIVVMDYAFGEQAYETLDELLKPYKNKGEEISLNIASISIMGKAGILHGGKGDLMVPTAHVFEGTADNYPIENEFSKEDFEGHGLKVAEGPMITVLGTSLQNRDILAYFAKSSWQAIGLEMEGAHYQKAIQAQVKIRGNVSGKVALRYAYYASDNPLVTGSTLASGSLGETGVKPTYLITKKILEKILG